MTAPGALTDHDVAAVRDEAATDKAVTVWFTAAAVGVPAGGSAKVVAVGDTAEGDFIQVRPAGTRDTMFCSPNELTRIRPARRSAARAAQQAGTPAPSTGARATGSTGGSAPPAVEKPHAAPVGSRAKPAAKEPVPAAGSAAPAGPSGSVHVAGSRRRVPRSGEISVSLKALADGEWTVEVLVGKERIVGPVPVQAADVAAAARSLPPTVAEAVEASLEGARQRQRDRVEQLRAELDAAQRVLDELGA